MKMGSMTSVVYTSLTATICMHMIDITQQHLSFIDSLQFKGVTLVEDKRHVLSVPPLAVSNESGLAEVTCAWKCAYRNGCLSFNLAVKPNAYSGLYRCELLAKYKYNSSNAYNASEEFNHFNFKTPCTVSPCFNNDTCIEDKNLGLSRCACAPGMTGDRCEAEIPPPRPQSLYSSIAANEDYQVGLVEEYVVPSTGKYLIRAGGTHVTSEGRYPGNYIGGKGATMIGIFSLTAGTVLKIVKGKRGGNSVEAFPEKTTATAASMGVSVRQHAGTGGGGGSFVYLDNHNLLIAAGGGGGASNGVPGVPGMSGHDGAGSVTLFNRTVSAGGRDGYAGTCMDAASYSTSSNLGGLGTGWHRSGCSRRFKSYGQPGKSKQLGWKGGRAGTMNTGMYGGPVPGAAGGYGGGGGGAQSVGASGSGGGYSGGGAGIGQHVAGGGGGSYCAGEECKGTTGGNDDVNGFVTIAPYN